MAKIKILIVEDESIIAEDLKGILESLDYEVVGIAYTASRAKDLLKAKKPDIVMLDIMLYGEHKGLELAEVINETYKIPFIFLTAHADHSTVEKARKTLPAAYLVKPYRDTEIYATIEIAIFNHMRRVEKSEPDSFTGEHGEVIMNNSFFIKDSGKYYKIRFDEILWVKSEGNYVAIKTLNKTHLVRMPLKKIVLKLKQPEFVQIHKSYVVARKHITHVALGFIDVGETTLPIGRKYRNDFMKDFTYLKDE